MVTEEEVKAVLPAKFNKYINKKLLDKLNGITTDPEHARQFRNNFLSYSNVARDKRINLADYESAITFITYKQAGEADIDAYKYAFPEKVIQVNNGEIPASRLHRYARTYARDPLVVSLLEQSYIPVWLVNQDIYQQAINRLAWLMQNSSSEKVQADSANSILTHLQKPRDLVNNVNIDLGGGSGLADLARAMKELASTQIKAIEGGTMTPKDIAEAVLVQEVEDDTEGE